jgi:hypothetical protein
MKEFTRAIPILLALLPGPVLADLRLTPRDCPPGAGCPAAARLSAFALSPSTPAMVGEALVLVGIGPGPTGAMTSLMALKIDLAQPPVLSGVTELDATPTETLGTVEVAPDGRAFALFTTDERDHLNRNRRMTVVQFFDEGGRRQGRAGPPPPAGWPEGAEGTPGDLLASQAGTQALQFAEGRMSLRFGRFLLSAGIADGRMTLAETAPGGEEDLEALANLMFDPVGGQVIRVRPGLTAWFTHAADGSPAQLALARTPASTPPDILAHGSGPERVIEPNAADYGRDYAALALSPDGTRLAALRRDAASCDPGPRAFALVVYDTGSGALVWSAEGVQDSRVQTGLVFTADNRLVLTQAQGAVAPPCGPMDAPPAVTVTVYDPALRP